MVPDNTILFELTSSNENLKFKTYLEHCKLTFNKWRNDVSKRNSILIMFKKYQVLLYTYYTRAQYIYDPHEKGDIN